MIQLNPPLPLDTPKGKGWGHVLIDYSQEHDILWVVFIDETGECWTFCNKDVRMLKNPTMNRTTERTEFHGRQRIDAGGKAEEEGQAAGI